MLVVLHFFRVCFVLFLSCALMSWFFPHIDRTLGKNHHANLVLSSDLQCISLVLSLVLDGYELPSMMSIKNSIIHINHTKKL